MCSQADLAQRFWFCGDMIYEAFSCLNQDDSINLWEFILYKCNLFYSYVEIQRDKTARQLNVFLK